MPGKALQHQQLEIHVASQQNILVNIPPTLSSAPLQQEHNLCAVQSILCSSSCQKVFLVLNLNLSPLPFTLSETPQSPGEQVLFSLEVLLFESIFFSGATALVLLCHFSQDVVLYPLTVFIPLISIGLDFFNSFFFLMQLFVYACIISSKKTLFGYTTQLQHEVTSIWLQFPDQGSNLGPLHWELRVSTNGPPGKTSLQFLLRCNSQK